MNPKSQKCEKCGEIILKGPPYKYFNTLIVCKKCFKTEKFRIRTKGKNDRTRKFWHDLTHKREGVVIHKNINIFSTYKIIDEKTLEIIDTCRLKLTALKIIRDYYKKTKEKAILVRNEKP